MDGAGGVPRPGEDEEDDSGEQPKEGTSSMGDDFEIRIIEAPVEPEPALMLPPSLRPDAFVFKKLPINQPSVFLHRLTCIFIHARSFRDCVKFAEGSLHREVAGVIVGKFYVHEGVRYITVTDLIRGQMTISHAATVVYTHDTWDAIFNEKDEKYPDHIIVGWFHTHPNFGIFLSANDTHIQNNFFPNDWQTAMVVDPVRKEYGFFRSRETNVCPEIVIYQEKDTPDANWGEDPLLKPYLRLNEGAEGPNIETRVTMLLKKLGL